jgi:hypothetical protein
MDAAGFKSVALSKQVITATDDVIEELKRYSRKSG